MSCRPLSLALLALTACGPSYLGSVPLEISPEAVTSADDIRIVAQVGQAVETFEIVASTSEGSRTYTSAEMESEPYQFEGRTYTLVIPASETSKGQTWTFQAIGRKGRGEMSGMAELTINNSAPTATVTLTPEMPTRGQPIQAVAQGEDLDGDELEFRYSWSINGAVTEHEGAEFPAMTARRNDRVTVSVVAFDGEDEGPPATATATLRNSPPIVEVVLSPETPNTTDIIVAEAWGTDPDEDSLSFEFSWELNGEQLPQTTPELPSVLTTRDDVVRARVVARDGRTISEPAFAEVVIANSPPTAPEVQIPSNEGQVSEFAPLLCDIVAPSTDPDRDPVSYVFTWYKNDEPWTGETGTTLLAGDTIEAEHTAEGDRWACEASATDGTAKSAPAMSGDIEIVAQLPYLIAVDQLINQGSDCSRDRVHKYNGCSGNYGFYWTDDGSTRPRSITVEYNHGINCGTGTRTAFLNGSSVGTAAVGESYNCQCEADAGTWVREYTYTSMSSYRPGARNEFTMSSLDCEGFSPNADWRDDGTNIYAIVTVNY